MLEFLPIQPNCCSDNVGVLEDDDLMALAVAQARTASTLDEVPVGAVVVVDGEVVASRHNERVATGDPTAHAEILAIRDAAAVRGDWRLDGAIVAVTLEPCAMCAGALLAARVARVVFAAPDLDAGALGSRYNLGADPRLSHEFAVTAGVRADECATLLSSFFAAKRDN